jgi:cytochrome c oxidase subunit III
MVCGAGCQSSASERLGILTTIVSAILDPPRRESERALSSLYTLGILIGLAIVTIGFVVPVLAFVLRSQRETNWLPIRLPLVLWFSSSILILSSTALETGRRRLLRDDQRGFHRLAICAALLGVLFLAGQMTAWFQLLASGVVLARNPHTAFLFFFSGLHGLHILLGLGGLFYLVRRTRPEPQDLEYEMTTRAWANSVSIFWHYLDLLWLGLFALLIFWKR